MTEIKAVDCKTFWKRSSGEIITFTEGTLMDIIQLARKDILSLITTIESQKVEIELIKTSYQAAMEHLKDYETQIESQKEEINIFKAQLNQAAEVINQLLPAEFTNRCEVVRGKDFLSSLDCKERRR